MDTLSTLPSAYSHQKTGYVLIAVGCTLLLIAALIGISDNLPGILLMLAGFFAIVFGIIYRVGKAGQRKPAQQFLYWAPRVLCIAFTAFTSLFAIDVFSENRGFFSTLLALLMHLIPTFILIAVLVLSWHREWIGGILFIALAALYVLFPPGRVSALAYGLVCGPLVLTGILFLLNWRYRSKLQQESKTEAVAEAGTTS